MDQAVANLAAESGSLERVSGIALPAGAFRILVFEFDHGALTLRCHDDTDEVCVVVEAPDPTALEVPASWAKDLIGKSIDHVWQLVNHRGYADAFQVRLRDNNGREATRQFEVAASVLHVSTITPTS